MKKIYIAAAFLLMASELLVAQNKSYITGGTIHVGNGKVIENGTIEMVNGKITKVFEGAPTIAGEVNVYDAKGKHVYPGIIAPNTTLGLTEIDAVRATNDFRETGNTNPHVRSQIAYNTDSDIIPTVRFNGVLLAQVTPRGGLVAGSSSVMKLQGWNWEDATQTADDGIHVYWPQLIKRQGWWAEPDKKIEKNKEYNNQKEEIKQLLIDAIAYNTAEKPVYNVKLSALKGVVNGTKNLYIHAHQMKEIMDAVKMCKDLGIKKIVVAGARESWKDPKFFVENNVAVILDRIHELPVRDQDDVNQPYKTPAILQKAGVLFCLDRDGDMDAMGQRNLPFIAGTACAYGLTKEEALAAITYNTAKILGIDKTVGTIEEGKEATLFVSVGDALDMRTNKVELALIAGQNVELNNNKQKQLYDLYMNKYGKK